MARLTRQLGILYGLLMLAVHAMSVPSISAAPPNGALPAEEGDSVKAHPIRVELGIDFSNRYFFRGIVQERSGFIVQPWAMLELDLAQSSAGSLYAVLGTWHSYHDKATGATSTDGVVRKWYEADLYAGLGAMAGRWNATAVYMLYTSPSEAFETVQDVTISVALDDEGITPLLALYPSLTLAVETGANGADSADGGRGVYLEVGVEPLVRLDDVFTGTEPGIEISFPVALGLSLSDYYEDADGSDATFGFVSISAQVTIPLGLIARSARCALRLGVEGLFLGDHARTYNRGR
ncbi:MAG: hypothetical protein KIS87_14875, partial [Phycisphaeraceae bacterium]|nr:hypothetical protein [Phycisphaeraceae bacterium]